MFWIVVIFLCGQLFFMYKGIENVPFFLYHMFSTRHPARESYHVLAIKTEKGLFPRQQLSNREYELLIGSAEYYKQLKISGDPTAKNLENRLGRTGNKLMPFAKERLLNDSADLANYPEWWARYFAEVTGNRYLEASLVEYLVQFTDSGRIAKEGKTLFTVNLPQ